MPQSPRLPPPPSPPAAVLVWFQNFYKLFREYICSFKMCSFILVTSTPPLPFISPFKTSYKLLQKLPTSEQGGAIFTSLYWLYRYVLLFEVWFSTSLTRNCECKSFNLIQLVWEGVGIFWWSLHIGYQNSTKCWS